MSPKIRAQPEPPKMLLLVSALLGVTLAVPLQNSVSYGNAVDFSTYATTGTFNCMKNAGYSVAFVRGYSPVGTGAFDNNSVANIKNAYGVGLGTEVYMTPQPYSNKTAAQQFDELYNGLYNQGITIRTIWFQVTSPVNWGSNTSPNINFISSLIVKAQNRAVTPGIYTNSYDWNQITGNWNGVPSGTMLWYWNVNGSGVSGETAANFNDYRSFGGFSSPSVKQYGQVESVCSTTVNRDVYAASQAFETLLKTNDNRIVVGGFISA